MSFDPAWIASVSDDLRAALRVRRILFIHTSSVHGSYLDPISACVETAASVAAAGLIKFTDDQIRNLVENHSVVFIEGVEKLKSVALPGSLSQLRATVHRLAECGVDICLISNDSKETYPSVAGSSVILDASSYALQPCAAKAGDEHGLSTVPAVHDHPDQDFRVLYAQALGQISIHALIELDRAIFEMNLDAYAFPAELASEVQEELRYAGLLRRDAIDGSLSFCVPARINNFRLALADALSSAVAAPEWLSMTSNDLFEIERLVRTSVRGAAIARHGDKWRGQLVSDDIATQVVENARRDGHYLVSKIEQLRDPLEWLSLGQLLDIVKTEKFGSVGPAQSLWERFRSEVVPIRNRVGHMRLISRTDQRLVRKWRMLLDRALGT